MVPTYGTTIQYAKHINQSPAATKANQKFIRQVVGVLLFYTRAVNATLLNTLSSLASAQAAPTEYTMSLVKWLLKYVATQPNSVLTYKICNMILSVHNDPSYLSEAKARSPVEGQFFCSEDSKNPYNNGAILNVFKIIKAVMSRGAKAGLGTLYINACKAVPLRQLLEVMDHKQPKTPIETDNITAYGVVNNNIQPQRTKAMDMCFHWLRCCESQNQFRYYWWPKTNNQVDYWTKHHCTAQDIEKHKEILTPKFILNALRASSNRAPATLSKGLVQATKVAPAE
jgi:hypothetical protein